MTEKDKEKAFKPSTLENIDIAMYQWLDEELDIYADTQHDGWSKVPVLWTGEERVYQVKEDRDIRDDNGALIFPLITLRRVSKSKSLDSKGSFWADIPEVDKVHGGKIPFARRMNHNKTNDFQRAGALRDTENQSLNFQTEKEKQDVVCETAYIPQPVYIDINYEVVLRSDHQQQMNEMVTPLVNYPGALNYFLVERNGWEYECFFEEEFTEDNNISSYDEEERVFKTAITINTLGYLIGDDDNEEGSEITVQENRVDVAVEEKIVTGSFF